MLVALQLADSAFPIGSFAFSHGLETAVERGAARGLTDVVALLETQIRNVLATQDMAVILAIHRLSRDSSIGRDPSGVDANSVDSALEGVTRLDQALFARKLVREPREASRRAGRAMLNVSAAMRSRIRFDRFGEMMRTGATPGLHPVVHGLVTSELDLTANAAATMFAHGFAMSGLSAAVRLLPIAHLDIQRALAHLQPAIVDAVQVAATLDPLADPGQMSSFAPFSDLLAIWHERGQARAFAT